MDTTVSAVDAPPFKSGANKNAQSRAAAFRELSKSGIVALVLISVLGGYLAGHPLEVPFNWIHLFATNFGVLFLAASTSALNQWQERHLDIKMDRTKNRPLPSGRLTSNAALFFIALCMSVGLFLLASVSWDVFWLGCLAVISYNGLYTLWWKKHWAYAAVPGAIPGALPIWIGHAAAASSVWAPAGIYLFALLFFWQMPHFWVIALKYREDYRQGGFPTLPVSRGEDATRMQIGVWGLAYVGLSFAAPLFLHVGLIYFALTLPLSLMVIKELHAFVRAQDTKNWLKLFLWVNFSLIGYVFAAVIDLWSVYLIQLFR